MLGGRSPLSRLHETLNSGLDAALYEAAGARGESLALESTLAALRDSFGPDVVQSD
jgi:hypothetical protein